MKRINYYYEAYNMDEKYNTLWNGYLSYINGTIPINHTYTQNKDKFILESNKDLEDLLAEICNINFYISLSDNKIYISHDTDEKYYYFQFEKNIRIVIKEIEDKFNVFITDGEFNANEVKHGGSQYKYTISKTDHISLKKKVLNWDNYESKKKKKTNNESDSNIIKQINDLTINGD